MNKSQTSLGIGPEALRRYLEARTGEQVEILGLRQLRGDATGATALKQFGYGSPLLVNYRAGDRLQREVFHRIRRNAFGREREEDRAAAVWLDFRTFNRLPRHAPAVDMVLCSRTGQLRSIGDVDELLLVTGFRPGHLYADDLVRIRDDGHLRSLDLARAEALARYLAEIHQVRHQDATLWRRRLRDLVGHGEGIMGLTDNYPPNLPYVAAAELRSIEEAANEWRWRLQALDHRLSQVHGDFHPFNVLFEDGQTFHILDRSRGEWGEPADDVSCMTINYLFFGLQHAGRLDGPFRELHDRFWAAYLGQRPDGELSGVIQPWFAWRALVLASPVWYPTISEGVRRKLLAFGRRVLSIERYEYQRINEYLEGV